MRTHPFLKSMIATALLACFAVSVRGQSNYNGALEYYTPQPISAPPLYKGQPDSIAEAYLWVDQLMRTEKFYTIERYIDSLPYGDTLQFLAKMLYGVVDDNPLSFNQWSGIVPWRVVKTIGYKTNPDQERVALQNHIGQTYPDTGRTGFFLACDIIADVTVTDTSVVSDPSDRITPHMVLVRSTLNDEIKGKFIPKSTDLIYKAGKSGKKALGETPIYPAIADTASAGTGLNFEYSPEWSSGVVGGNDERPFWNPLSDSTGWWIKPGKEYIVFLYFRGIGDDSTNQYFTVDPFWGVLGTQGAMYRVVNGHVVDPNDDFGLGGTNLTVADWKARLRQRIYSILNP